jgi:hypothetical protein
LIVVLILAAIAIGVAIGNALRHRFDLDAPDGPTD